MPNKQLPGSKRRKKSWDILSVIAVTALVVIGINKLLSDKTDEPTYESNNGGKTPKTNPFVPNNAEIKVDFDDGELLIRANELGRKNLEILYSIIKVIGLTTATIVLLNIILKYQVFDTSQPVSFQAIWDWHKSGSVHHIFDLKIIFWITSCMVLIVTYDAALFSTIFITKIQSKWATLLIYSFIGFEFFLFAVLYPAFFTEKEVVEMVTKESGVKGEILPNFASCWFLIYGVYHLCIGLFCIDGLNSERHTLYYKKELKSIIRKHYKGDMVITFLIGFVCLAFTVIMHFCDRAGWIYKHKFQIQFIAACCFLGAAIFTYFLQAIRKEDLIKKINL